MGFARLAESWIRNARGKGEGEKLTAAEKILSSSIGGALATWNQPIEVVRVEMQSMSKATNVAGRPAKQTILSTLSYIYRENGIKGLYRGVTPRIGLGIWQTVCMVSFADYVKAWYVVCLLHDCFGLARVHLGFKTSRVCNSGSRSGRIGFTAIHSFLEVPPSRTWIYYLHTIVCTLVLLSLFMILCRFKSLSNFCYSCEHCCLLRVSLSLPGNPGVAYGPGRPWAFTIPRLSQVGPELISRLLLFLRHIKSVDTRQMMLISSSSLFLDRPER
jgi:hypothetical protein